MTTMIYTSSWKSIQQVIGGQMKANLRRFRFDRGELSQQQLADMVSVSRQTIISIERGDYAPSVKLALLLAAKLETTVEQLFQLEEKDYA
jgi:putative transcriptional regulator